MTRRVIGSCPWFSRRVFRAGMGHYGSAPHSRGAKRRGNAAVEQCPKGICLELLVLPAAERRGNQEFTAQLPRSPRSEAEGGTFILTVWQPVRVDNTVPRCCSAVIMSFRQRRKPSYPLA